MTILISFKYALSVMEATGIIKFFYGLYSRKHCQKVSENVYIKNLKQLGFPEDRTVLIDVAEPALAF